MGSKQYAVIAVSVLLVLILFFAFDTIPSEKRDLETSRPADFDNGALIALVESSMASLRDDEAVAFRTLANVIQSSDVDSVRINALKQMSSSWFSRGAYLPAGYYAEQVAEREATAQAWAIAGSTFAFALTDDETPDDAKRIARDHAVQCFENAISLDPDEVEYRINLAICYVEYPPDDNPMRGIQSLLALNEKHPENTAVMYHLARFGLQTGQYDKAIERLNTAILIDPEQKRLHCLLAEAYSSKGDAENAAEHAAICDKID